MLILTRNISEKIIINDNIEITVVNIKGHIAVLGFVAPREIKIMRTEIIDKPKKEKSETEIIVKKSKIKENE